MRRKQLAATDATVLSAMLSAMMITMMPARAAAAHPSVECALAHWRIGRTLRHRFCGAMGQRGAIIDLNHVGVLSQDFPLAPMFPATIQRASPTEGFYCLHVAAQVYQLSDPRTAKLFAQCWDKPSNNWTTLPNVKVWFNEKGKQPAVPNCPLGCPTALADGTWPLVTMPLSYHIAQLRSPMARAS